VISLLADGRFDTSLLHPATGNYKLSFNNNAIVLVQERTEPPFQNENNTWSIILAPTSKLINGKGKVQSVLPTFYYKNSLI